MKKSLIALAVLAAAGTAFAQATITGKFAGAYQDNTNKVTTDGKTDSVKKNGFGVTDGNVTFAASEDLGGGMTAGVSMDVRVRGRAASGSVDGRNATVYVRGGFGTVTFGAIEAANGIHPLGSAGAPIQGLDDTSASTTANLWGSDLTAGQVKDFTAPLSRAGNVDALIYRTPNFGGITGTLMLIDSIGAPGTGGMENSAKTQDATLIGMAYAAGPLAASADYTNYGANNNATSAVNYYADKRIRLSGSYDLGVAKLGAGYQTQTRKALSNGNAVAGADDLTIKEYILGVSAPIGAAIKVGANYTRRSADDNTYIRFTGHDVTGWDVGAQYNLSKRTAVQASYRKVKAELFDGVLGAEDKNLRIRLMHSF